MQTTHLQFKSSRMGSALLAPGAGIVTNAAILPEANPAAEE
jgi:hypothetical protein